MMKNNIKILILGMGNILMGDDGFGVIVVNEILEHKIPENVKAVEIGTSSMNYLNLISRSENVLIIDAIMTGKKPGTLFCINLDTINRNNYKYNQDAHSFSIMEIIALSRHISNLPDKSFLFGIEPEKISFSLELSKTVSEKVKITAERVIKFSENILL